MGIYTSNNYFGRDVYDYAAEIPANEAYDAAFGCAHVLADCQANDMALFESTIYSDMNEVMAVQEGVQVVNENAFTNVIKKIVEMFKKLIAKIKGIFKAFIAKLEGLFKNGKDLVKKYEKQILKCSNWKKFKCKIRKPNKTEDIIGKIDDAFGTMKTSTGAGNRYKINNFDGLTGMTTPDAIKKADADDIKEALLKLYIKDNTINLSDYKDFSENTTEYLYEDEDTIDGDDDNVSSSTFTAKWIKGVLEEKKLITNAEKLNKKLDDEINGIIDDLNKSHDNLVDFMKKNGEDSYVQTQHAGFGSASVDKDSHRSKNAAEWTAGSKGSKGTGTGTGYDSEKDATNAGIVDPVQADDGKWYASTTGSSAPTGAAAKDTQQIIVAMQKIASNEQEVVTKVTSEYMAQLKFAVSQARKMWTAAAAYSSTEHKEDASYYIAVGECAAEQAYQKFESIH